MDKSKLFYLVMKGTNRQALTTTREPLLVTEDAVDRVLGEYSSLYEKISVEDFEEQFADNKDGDKDE